MIIIVIIIIHEFATCAFFKKDEFEVEAIARWRLVSE